jgi:chaperonin GroES
MHPADLTNPELMVERPGSINNVVRVKPLYDRVMVRRIEALSRTKGGLYIPETAKEKPIEGIVVAVGHGRYIAGSPEIKSLVVKEGDHVLFAKNAGNEVIVNEVEHLILREDEILSVVNRVERLAVQELMSLAARMSELEAEEALQAISERLKSTPQRKEHNLPA